MHTWPLSLDRRDPGAYQDEEAGSLAYDRDMLHQFATTDSVTVSTDDGGVETVFARFVWLRPCADRSATSQRAHAAFCP